MHPLRPTHEQFVRQRLTQLPKSMTDCGLGEIKSFPCLGHVPLFHQSVEDADEIEIDIMNVAHSSNYNKSFQSWKGRHHIRFIERLRFSRAESKVQGDRK